MTKNLTSLQLATTAATADDGPGANKLPAVNGLGGNKSDADPNSDGLGGAKASGTMNSSKK